MSRQPPAVRPAQVAELAGKLAAAGIAAVPGPGPAGPATLLDLDPADWGRAAGVAASAGLRFSATWGEHLPPRLTVTTLLFGGDGHLLLRTALPDAAPQLPSQTPAFVAADRPERHLQDLFGVRYADHPDGRRWIRHQAWPGGVYPLRRGVPLAGEPPQQTPPDSAYPFAPIAGSGVYEIPVGPVHAGIIEPGHFRFQAVGEEVLALEEHLGYVHKGIEKLAEGRDLAGLSRLAGRVSGDSSVAHAWAACQAAERALGAAVPARALALRGIFCERERIANHLGDIGAICNDVGFTFAQVQMTRQRELWQRTSAAVFGHRLLMDRVVPGGVAVDLPADRIAPLREEAWRLKEEIEKLLPLLLEYPSLQDRLRETGVLAPAAAERLGVVGYLGRASNLQDDLRRDAPYPPYDRLRVEVPAYLDGDVAKRVRVRGEEILVALQLIDTLLVTLPAGAVRAELPKPKGECAGLGLVEGWRGETVAFVRLGEDGRVLRYFPRDPSWLAWPALELLIHGNIVPDFPVCNKSVNGSYSGVDL